MEAAKAMLAFVVREAIGRIAAPEVAERIEAAALLRGGHREIPSQPAELASFVDHALYETIEDYLGEDVAEAVKADLEPIIAQAEASSGVRKAPPRSEQPPRDVRSHAMRSAPPRAGLPWEDEPAPPPEESAARSAPAPFAPFDDGERRVDEDETPSLELAWDVDHSEFELETDPPIPSTGTAADRRPPKSELSTAPPQDEAAGGGRRILIADDDANVLDAMGRALRSEGFDVITASDGYAALELCQSMRPDVVVADLHMPAISGRQLVGTLQRTMGSEAPPVIIVTGNVFAPNNVEGCAEVLRKPVDLDELTTAIELAAWDHDAGI